MSWWGTVFFLIAIRKLAGVICYFIGFCLLFCYGRIKGKKLSNISLGEDGDCLKLVGIFGQLQLILNEKMYLALASHEQLSSQGAVK